MTLIGRSPVWSRNGLGVRVLRSRAHTANGEVSRIQATLTPDSMVTTLKNTVDHVVTEFGAAEMRGKSISQRARALISIAHPQFRDRLTEDARDLHYL